MKLIREFLQTSHISVRFSGLELDYRTDEGIRRIALLINTAIKMDHVMKGIIRITCAMVLIGINSDCSYPKRVSILDEHDNLFWQNVQYEWQPIKCTNCKCFGHLWKCCPMVTSWVPKHNNRAGFSSVAKIYIQNHYHTDLYGNRKIIPLSTKVI